MSSGSHRAWTVTQMRQECDDARRGVPPRCAVGYVRLMSDKPRDQSAGYHHVYTRGNNKRQIYCDDSDRFVFSLMVNRTARKYGWRVLAYCLMGNHYHLVIRIDEGQLSRGMCELNTGWARYFNARHGRINHLFGRRFSNRKIHGTASLLNRLRYVVQNPRRAGEDGPLEGFVWTSYATTIGLALGAIEVARDEVLQLLSRSREHATTMYRDFCEEVVPSSELPRQPP
jgi:REP element-mobilizing transposase RayT